ncbi:MAG: cytochrome c family protein [Sphingomicrobium sp.]
MAQDDRFNTIAGWVLFAGIVALGTSIVGGEMFHGERPETGGYPIEGVVQEGDGAAAAEQPIEVFLAKADVAKGQQVFNKCAACHNADKGGANQLGPNLWGVLGEPIGQGKGFAFSPALSKVGGTWDWTSLNHWLSSPRAMAPGTKMTFAGLGSPQDRADVIAFLNAHSDSPQPLPAAPAATTDASADKPGTGPGNGPQKAENEPVPTTAGPAGKAAEAEANPKK